MKVLTSLWGRESFLLGLRYKAPSVTTTIVLIRFAKLVFVGLFFAGSVGSVIVENQQERKRFTFYLAAPSLAITWLLGFVLVGFLQLPILSLWVIGSLILSMLALQVALYVSMGENRGGTLSLLLVLVSLVGTVALMVFRPV